MNNEPVAYINKDDGLVCAKCYKPFTKELTDEEIMDCFKEVNLFTANMVDVARAILKKAQEK
jgi:hypothetical protein